MAENDYDPTLFGSIVKKQLPDPAEIVMVCGEAVAMHQHKTSLILGKEEYIPSMMKWTHD